MLNKKVNECVHACNRCAAICIQRASASFVSGDPVCVAQRLLLDQETLTHGGSAQTHFVPSIDAFNGNCHKGLRKQRTIKEDCL